MIPHKQDKPYISLPISLAKMFSKHILWPVHNCHIAYLFMQTVGEPYTVANYNSCKKVHLVFLHVLVLNSCKYIYVI